MTLAVATEEQEMLRATARRALADAVDRRALAAGAASDPAFVAEIWSLAATMGWTGLLVPAASGGLGLTLADAVLLGEELGRALYPAPFTATSVAAAALIGGMTAPAWHEDILPAIATGRMRLAVIGLDECAAAAVPSGRHDLVEYADSATHFLVVDGGRPPRLTALLIPADAPGVAITMRQPFDVTCPIGSVDLSAVVTTGMLCGEISAGALQVALARRRVMASAELVGVAGAALDMALSYAGERRQFGVPIGSFQAIKHRLADGFVLLESARLATYHAARSCDGEAPDGDVMIDVAWRCAVEAALRVTADCIQVHGALGFSWEHDAHLFLKRARRLAAMLGDAAPACDAIGDLLANVARGGGAELFSPIGLTMPAPV
jgi:alkylation response protein AidB-like acyl-CoA dehydrogenase